MYKYIVQSHTIVLCNMTHGFNRIENNLTPLADGSDASIENHALKPFTKQNHRLPELTSQ